MAIISQNPAPGVRTPRRATLFAAGNERRLGQYCNPESGIILIEGQDKIASE
jgi:hypothetical protein